MAGLSQILADIICADGLFGVEYVGSVGRETAGYSVVFDSESRVVDFVGILSVGESGGQ